MVEPSAPSPTPPLPPAEPAGGESGVPGVPGPLHLTDSTGSRSSPGAVGVRDLGDPSGGGLAPVVAADLEGTCTSGETWRGVARWLGEHGRRGHYRRFLLPRMAALPLVRVGLIERQDFKNRWIRDLARLLAGLDAGTVAAMVDDVVERDLWPGRRTAVLDELAAASAGGARIVIASGTYQPVLERFVDRLDHPAVALGTPLQVHGGRLSGHLEGRVGTGVHKAVRVRAVAAGAHISVAYGDSAADIPMLEAADVAVAVAPDAELRREALARGWRVLEA